MPRKAVVGEGGIVENVIIADDGFTIPGKTLVDAGESAPGWTHDSETGTFTAPVVEEEEQPEEETPE